MIEFNTSETITLRKMSRPWTAV